MCFHVFITFLLSSLSFPLINARKNFIYVGHSSSFTINDIAYSDFPARSQTVCLIFLSDTFLMENQSLHIIPSPCFLCILLLPIPSQLFTKQIGPLKKNKKLYT